MSKTQYHKFGVTALLLLLLFAIAQFSPYHLTTGGDDYLQARIATIDNTLKVWERKARRLEMEAGVWRKAAQGHEIVNSWYYKSVLTRTKPDYEKITYNSQSVDTKANDLLIISSVGSSTAFGDGRRFSDYLETLDMMDFDKSKTTLGLLVASREDFLNIQEIVEQEGNDFYSKVVLLHSAFIESLHKFDREQRHKPLFQRERRRVIARARNFLVTNTLTDESATLCVDSDIIELPSDMLTIFEKSGLDVINPRVKHSNTADYDRNAWKGSRKEPNDEESKRLDANDPEFSFTPMPENAKNLEYYMKTNHGNDGTSNFAVELDSVGGAVLYVRSEIFKQGVLFPPLYIIGTKWYRGEGFDGIETEGLCYQAKALGYKCWGMPNVVATHIVDNN